MVRVDVLLVDDWAMAPLSDLEGHDFLEICEDRYQIRSTVLTSQLPVAQWHAQIGDPTLADSILDRLVHNAHRIEMQGESMRKKRAGKETERRRCAPKKPESGAVEMTPRGKRGKLQKPKRVSDAFHRAWKPGKNKNASFPHSHRAGGGFSI